LQAQKTRANREKCPWEDKGRPRRAYARQKGLVPRQMNAEKPTSARHGFAWAAFTVPVHLISPPFASKIRISLHGQYTKGPAKLSSSSPGRKRDFRLSKAACPLPF
jgi:hypothetical protein